MQLGDEGVGGAKIGASIVVVALPTPRQAVESVIPSASWVKEAA